MAAAPAAAAPSVPAGPSDHDIATYGYYYATKVANAYVYDPWTDSRAGRKTIGTADLYDAGAPYGDNIVW